MIEFERWNGNVSDDENGGRVVFEGGLVGELGAPRTLRFNEFAELFWFFYCDWAIRRMKIESFY